VLDAELTALANNCGLPHAITTGATLQLEGMSFGTGSYLANALSVSKGNWTHDV